MLSFNIKYFSRAVIISLCVSMLLFLLSFIIGPKTFFLLLNGNLGIASDYFFGIFTNAGDGLMWVAVLFIVLFVLKQKKAWPLLLYVFVITTLLTQLCKYVIIPDAPRPWKAITNHALIHHVSFITPFSISSFPSGHTATAFSIYLLLSLFINKKWWLYAGLAYALLVGYSRIYVAQHFPFDVAAGALTGTISVLLSLQIQLALSKKPRPAIAFEQ